MKLTKLVRISCSHKRIPYPLLTFNTYSTTPPLNKHLEASPAAIERAMRGYNAKIKAEIWAFINATNVEHYVTAFREQFPAGYMNADAVEKYRTALLDLQQTLCTEDRRHHRGNLQYAITCIKSTLELHNTITTTDSPNTMAEAVTRYQEATKLPTCEKMRMVTAQVMRAFGALVVGAYAGAIVGLMAGVLAAEIIMTPAILPACFVSFATIGAISAVERVDEPVQSFKHRLAKTVPSYFFARCSTQCDEVVDAVNELETAPAEMRPNMLPAF